MSTTTHTPLSREEWLAKRREIITATDVAKIAGLSRWGSQLSVFLEKRGLSEVQETPAMRLGKQLQPVVLDLYEQDTGEGLKRYEDTELVISRDLPWAGATPDAETLTAAHRLVEAKTAGPRQAHRWGEPGTDDVPEEYLVQVQWQMLCTGAKAADLAVLLAGQDFRIYRIQRHDALVNSLVMLCDRFRTEHLVTGNVPPMDGSAASAEYLRRLFPREIQAELRQADEDAEMRALRLHEARMARDEAQNSVDLLEARMKADIGEAAGVQGRLWRATWKATKDTSMVDWPAVALHLAKDFDALKAAKEQFTTTKPGVRRFLFKFNGEG